MIKRQFKEDFIALVELEYQNMPISVRNDLEHTEVKCTRYLDEQSELASVNVLYGLGKDQAWEYIERSIYRMEMHRVANTVLFPNDENVRDEDVFVKSNKWRLEDGTK